jgi:hypothetical protein
VLLCECSHWHAPTGFESIQKLLQEPSVANYITDAIFDYMTLLKIPYDALFQCMCNHTSEQRRRIVGIYDNSCKWLHFMMLRFPSLSQNIQAFIDTMHYQGHKNCSPFFCARLNLVMRHFNGALNEQKNRKVNYMKVTSSQMAQPRNMVYTRYHIAMLNLVQVGMDEIYAFVSSGVTPRVCEFA